MDQPGRILFVDDEENVLKSMKRLFLDDEYEILTASSGEAGLAVLRSGAPVPVIISDYRMPGMNGVEFLREVHAHWPDTVRMVLSGYADTAAVIEAINEGRIYKFIAKPWNNEELKIAVANALERYSLRQQNARLSEELKRRNEELRTLNDILKVRITEELASLKAKNSELSHVRDIVESLPVAVLDLDPEGWITYYNAGMRDLCGWGNGSVVYRKATDVLPGEIQEAVARLEGNGPRPEFLRLGGQALAVSGVRRGAANQKQGLILMLTASGNDTGGDGND